MALPDILTGLMRPAAYPHACDRIQLIETHISWVLLTGEFAYKIKKPVHLPFVDFSTLERRHFFCAEEVRCNRHFSADLYLGVVPVCRADGGAVAMGGSGTVVDWAVQMRQFPSHLELDRLLTAGALTVELLRAFGARLAMQHQALPSHTGSARETVQRVLAPVDENFTTLGELDLPADDQRLVEDLRRRVSERVALLRPHFDERLALGFTRECHGDLHLGNLVLLGGEVVAFDCLEFDANLRWIDTISDAAFLFMDCLVRGRRDLAYAFMDGYLDRSEDYAGAQLLPFYSAYRAMVRAKVAAIQASQARMRMQLQWAATWLHRPPGRLVLMSGLSGSGKSYLAARLAPAMAALRLRSDVARHQVGKGLSDAQRYAPARRALVYDRLASLAHGLIGQGETVILDATFLARSARSALLAMATANGSIALILHCHAPLALLQQRIRARQTAGDASEADLAVLEQQVIQQEPFGQDEPVLEIDMSPVLDERRLGEITGAISDRFSALAGA
jgi:aminoglycoside phosphotransferase family enzyme/predicted kinase